MSGTRMTVGQAIVRFLSQQYVLFDGEESRFVEGIFTIFGHGNVLGLGQALDENPCGLKIFQGRNEQGMAHAAAAYAKQNNRRKILAVTSSVGPGAANMVTAAACATVNQIPLLLFPGDTFSTRQPDPVLQQLEVESCPGITTNDAFKPVCRYFDRIERPQQLMSAMMNAMGVLTSPSQTGAVCIALPQDVQGEAYEFPESFFAKRVHLIPRAIPVKEELDQAVKLIKQAERPMMICGGGVRYSEAGKVLAELAKKHGIPYGETQAGKSATPGSCEWNMGGIGVTGCKSANRIAAQADLIIGVGSRLSDFTTCSKQGFTQAKLLTINVSGFHARKMEAVSLVGDARTALSMIGRELEEAGYFSRWGEEPARARGEWDGIYRELAGYTYGKGFEPIVKARAEKSLAEFKTLTGGEITQTAAIALIREMIERDAIVCGASGSLPGCLQRMWTTDSVDSYHMEYGFSCMGYEISAGFGCKLAKPDQEVYVMVGDGSFQMLHSELMTSLMERKKITVLLFDNCGFGCINNLQMGNGVGSLATEFRYRQKDSDLRPEGGLIPVDYAGIASAYGADSYRAGTLEELKEALEQSRKSSKTVLIDIKVLPKTMTEGYDSWWHVGVAAVSASESVQAAYRLKEENLERARKY